MHHACRLARSVDERERYRLIGHFRGTMRKRKTPWRSAARRYLRFLVPIDLPTDPIAANWAPTMTDRVSEKEVLDPWVKRHSGIGMSLT